MADILHVPTHVPRKGRRRERPIKGAPFALVIDGLDFRGANKPTYADVRLALDRIAYQLLWAMRATKEIFPAYE